MAKLADFGNMAEAKTLTSMSDIADEPVSVLGFTLARGEHGVYVTMKIKRSNAEVCTVRTASAAIIQALKEVKAKNAFPVEATFVLHGKTWLCE